MILYGGINVYPQEIEQALIKCDGVEEVVVSQESRVRVLGREGSSSSL